MAINPAFQHARCIGCGSEYPVDQPMNLCPIDGRPVEMLLDTGRLGGSSGDLSWYQPEIRSMWRFGAMLPIQADDGVDTVVSLGEGHTPELDYSEHPLALKGGFTLKVKDEGKAHPGFGANPTQSFKDRGMAVTVNMARELRISRLAVPTQGNAGDSLAVYAVAAGLDAVIAMPGDTPMPILGGVAALASQRDGIKLVTVEGTIREANEALERDWLPRGWFSVATFREPGWRIEGKKTLGLELAEPDRPDAPWSLPDVVIYPTGGGTGVLGMWKAFAELEALGLIGPERPRMACVQSAATAPLVAAFENGSEDTVPGSAGKTLAYGLNVPGGVGHFRVLQIIRESDGTAVAVDEESIQQALAAAWRDHGWWMCPEGAACIAALPQLLDGGIIRPGDSVVAFNTGSLEKYLPSLRHLL
jgi:threonine synthase